MPKLQPVVLFGSGPLAAEALEHLVGVGFIFSTVITRPKPDHGHLTIPPVEAVCNKHSLSFFTPSNKQELADLFAQNALSNHYGLVIDYGLIIPQAVIDHFKFGIVNSHFSLLPLLRGADPITFAILNGDKETGVSLMIINDRMDEGQLLTQKSLLIDEQENSLTLTRKLSDLSNKMLAEYVPDYLSGTLKPYPQDPNLEPTYSRKLQKSDGFLDFAKPAVQLEREVRAFVGWPKSSATLKGDPDIEIIVTKASAETISGTAGSVEQSKGKLLIYCASGALKIERLKVSGKPEMSAQAFLNGYGRKLAT